MASSSEPSRSTRFTRLTCTAWNHGPRAAQARLLTPDVGSIAPASHVEPKLDSNAPQPAMVVASVTPAPVKEPPRALAGGASDPQMTPVTNEERRVYAASVFDSETINSSWALPAQRRLQDAIPKILGTGGELENIECRSSLCRVKVQHDGRSGQQQFLRRLVQSATWPGAGTAVRDNKPGGPSRLILYLAREGVSPPEPPVQESAP